MFKRTLSIAILLSVLLHLSALVLLKKWTPPVFTPSETIEITLEPENKVLPPSTIDETQKQIISQDEKAVNDEIDEKAKFLGHHNQRVVRESKATKHGELKNSAGGRENVTEQNVRKSRQARARAASKLLKSGTLPTFAELKPQFNWDVVTNRGLDPNQKDVSQQSDYLKDVDDGVQTLLSTREFIYYSYYSRIKNQLQQHWEPKIKEKMRKIFLSGRKIASTGDKITQLIIVLNRDGILQKVRVVGESGVSDLDDAAVEAFKAAAPFPNPPNGIVESDGTIQIRWDFVLEA